MTSENEVDAWIATGQKLMKAVSDLHVSLDDLKAKPDAAKLAPEFQEIWDGIELNFDEGLISTIARQELFDILRNAS